MFLFPSNIFLFDKGETSVTLDISHLSHEPKTMVFHQNDLYPVTISLKPVVRQLKEVAILPEENPAHRIIDSLTFPIRCCLVRRVLFCQERQ